MNEIRDAILEGFDIRSLDKKCNVKNCNKPPEKKITLSEYRLRKGRKDFATLYVCGDHEKKVKKMLKKLKEIIPEKIILSKVENSRK